MTGVGVTNGLTTHDFQNNYVERLMDDAAFTAAHPNNTLVLAGPARFSAVSNIAEDLLPLGMLQGFNFSTSRPTTPVMSIGSGRSFFLSGKSQIGFGMSRLLVNGRNLLRALQTQVVRNRGALQRSFLEPPGAAGADGLADTFWIDFDSEVFYIPFGLCVIYRSVSGDRIGGFYMELCMLNSFSSGFGAGQNMVMDNVQGVADRIRPLPRAVLQNARANGPDGANIVSEVLKQSPQPLSSLLDR